MSAFVPTHSGRAAERPRLGFLGVGWIGRQRMEAVAKSRVAEIAAIADSVAEAVAEAGYVAPRAALMHSLNELLDADVDGIVIATPSALHAEQAIAALNRGVAVFCQKPLGRTARETRAIVDAARKADRLLAVDLSYRFTTGMRKIREFIQSGELGAVYAINLIFHNAYGPDQAWFYDPKLSGGGCVIDLGIHLVDLALWVLDFPRVAAVSSRLFSQGKPLRRRAATVEDYAVARLDLEDGAVAQLACSWKLPAGCDALIEASFYGTRGGASFRNVNGSFSDFIAERFKGTARERLSAPPDQWGGRAIIEWARQLAINPSFDPAVERLVDVAAVLDAMYER
jgi:predicted dehydrogenase